jgi:hypothetical protein
MNQEPKYPYQHINTFVTAISFARGPEIPTKLDMPTTVQVQLIESGFPRVQFAMKISSPENAPEDAPIIYNLEVVSIFDYMGSEKENNNQLNREFGEERALHMLWVYSSQIIKTISSQMGMNPLELRSPVSFNFTESKHPESKKKARSTKPKTTKKAS